MFINKRVLALVIDGSMDFSLGIIAAGAVSYFFGDTLTWWLILIGVAGAYTPDLDGLHFFVANGMKDSSANLYTHRSGIHYPLLYLPTVIVGIGSLGLVLASSYTAILTTTFAVGSFFHFVHDTFLHGWGISWLYPFSKKRIALLHHTKSGRSISKVFIFPVEKLYAIREEYRDPSWYELLYHFPPHPWAYSIVIVHLIGLVIVFV